MSVILASGVRKRYGQAEALAGVDLEIEQGEVFALLGPNGAGKTTLVEILEGYRDRTAGEVRVLGTDTVPATPRGGAGSASCSRGPPSSKPSPWRRSSRTSPGSTPLRARSAK